MWMFSAMQSVKQDFRWSNAADLVGRWEQHPACKVVNIE